MSRGLGDVYKRQLDTGEGLCAFRRAGPEGEIVVIARLPWTPVPAREPSLGDGWFEVLTSTETSDAAAFSAGASLPICVFARPVAAAG